MSLKAHRDAARRIRAGFEAAGAVPVDCPILLPAETLLDLYGEDMRARAYVTQDPSRGEQMLRPDFTVAVIERHMAEGAAPARYTYAGEVFRRQEAHPERANEYLQAGFEIVGGADPDEADAEVFSVIRGLLPETLRAATGDIGILTAAVAGLETSEARKAALMRHIWRPRRFRQLLDRFAGRLAPPDTRTALLAADAPEAAGGPAIGVRTRAEVAARIELLRADARTPPLSANQVALIGEVLKVAETCPFALQHLRDIAVDLPALREAVDRFERRLDALSRRGIDVDALVFEASYGRSSMEYYDGFVFGFTADDHPELSPIATGGRYDALTARLGQGPAIPAVGGVIRPDLLMAVRGEAR